MARARKKSVKRRRSTKRRQRGRGLTAFSALSKQGMRVAQRGRGEKNRRAAAWIKRNLAAGGKLLGKTVLNALPGLAMKAVTSI